jgi:outer membrane lipoprotein-sorting protein
MQMRWSALLVLLLVAAPAIGQGNDAEKLFRATEKKIRAAKSLQLTFTAEMTGAVGKISIKGNAYLATGNKIRAELYTDIVGKSITVLIVSNGKSTYTKEGDAFKVDNKPAEPGQYDKALASMARLGLMTTHMLLSEKAGDAAFDIDKEIPAKSFKLGPKEMIGSRTAQVVEYVIEPKNESPINISLYLDTQTQLPLKLVATGKMGKDAFRMVETYSVYTIDGKIDAKLFEIPK